MLLEPDSTWCWKFDKESRKLKLVTKGNTYCTAHAESDYLPDVYGINPFSLDDVTFMNDLGSALAPLSIALIDKNIMQDLLVNATAVNRFYKELVAKSWVFRKQAEPYHPEFGEVIYLTSDDGEEDAPFIAIKGDKLTTICISVTKRTMEYQTQKYRKQIRYCEAIKVMNDRIQCTALINSPATDGSLLQHLINLQKVI